ncbi:class I SAM-dependent methyltransferase [Sphingomonas sp.]|jgi:SAM-dependent methyltransferase|uniref:class I SAM-dependent methyltransferase n=1 Tax=Sphingomonas sp. TaxID=28214 RepID=UPI002EDB336C
MTQAADWTGRIGDVWAQEWQRTDRSFAALTPHLDAAILAAAPSHAFRALDIGCGAGATAHALATARGDADVIGADLSEGLIAVARSRPPLPNLRFVVCDATAAAATPVDLYVSRHGVMFFDDPEAAFARLARAAAPGAALVFSCFAERRANRFAADLLDALGRDGDAPAGDDPGPFAFADPMRVAAMLTAAGWQAAPPARVDFGYRAGEGAAAVADAVAFFHRIGSVAGLLRDAPISARAGMERGIEAACARRLNDGAVDFPAAAWIWSATKPGSAL